MNSLEIKNLHKQFIKGKTILQVLKGVDLTTTPGQFIAITGESGSGKSTFLNLIGGFDKPGQGEIHINGQNITGLSEKNFSLIRNQLLGFVWQNHQLLSDFSAVENVALPLAVATNNWGKAKEKARDYLSKVGLKDRTEHTIFELSGGEMQRVSIARSLINNPNIILADEPTGNLDEHHAQEIMNLLINLTKEQKSTLILVTHSKSIANTSDVQYQLKKGVLTQIK